MIGTIGFHKWSRAHLRAEIGYDLSPEHWGKGYMGEAARAATDRGFQKMGLHRIDARVYVENQPSIRLLQRLGFKQEGTLRDYFRLSGTFYDHFVFSLLAGEWRAGA